MLKARGRLSGEDIGRLEELGFLWQPHRTIWQQRLEELAEFKAAYGHCNVPAVYPDNPSLGRWLDHQRQKRKGGTLLQGRGAQLEALGVSPVVISGSTIRASPTKSSRGRRSSGYFIPIAQPKKRGKQLQFDTEWTVDRYKESEFINTVRRRVGMWRQGVRLRRDA